jgi:hypothetical protein
MRNYKLAVAVAFVLGVSFGSAAVVLMSRPTLAGEAPPPPDAKPVDVAALKADVEKLKGMINDQSHVMADVAYHYSNLWFAGRQENWPLAQFYADEVRSHLRWAVRVIPVRKDPKGVEIKLADILGPIETGNLEDLRKSIGAKDKVKFEDSYRAMMDSCYACHMAIGKPYLRLQVPEHPEAPIVNMVPAKE